MATRRPVAPTPLLKQLQRVLRFLVPLFGGLAEQLDTFLCVLLHAVAGGVLNAELVQNFRVTAQLFHYRDDGVRRHDKLTP